MQSIEAQCIIKQYALYGRYCFVTCWRVVCCTYPPALWPSDTVCQSAYLVLPVLIDSWLLIFLVCPSFCFDCLSVSLSFPSALVVFVWWAVFLTGWVFAIYWSTVRYKTVCLIWKMPFYNSLTCNVLHGLTFLVDIGPKIIFTGNQTRDTRTISAEFQSWRSRNKIHITVGQTQIVLRIKNAVRRICHNFWNYYWIPQCKNIK